MKRYILLINIMTVSLSAMAQSNAGGQTNDISIYIVGVLLIALLAVGIAWWRKRKQCQARKEEMQRKIQEMEEKLEAAIKEKDEVELIRNQVTTFFINSMLEHITQVINPLREIKQRPSLPANFPNTQSAYRNAVMVKNAGEQMMNIYVERRESDLPLKDIGHYYIEKIINEVNESVNEMIDTTDIIYRCNKFIRPDLKVWVNRDKFIKMLKNILMNAFNHIKFAGMVNITFTEEVSDESSNCIITVSYNTHFKVVKAGEIMGTSHIGEMMGTMELGYDIMEKVIAKGHGNINLKSEEGQTSLTITLPTQKEIFNGDTNVEFNDVDEKKIEEEKPNEGTGDAEKTNSEGLENDVTPSDKGSESNLKGAEKEEEIEENEQKNKNSILIIESRPEIGTYMKVLLSDSYNINIENDGIEGVEKAMKQMPDLILCDVSLPGKSGFEVCKDIKSDVTTGHIPLILITSEVEDEDIVRGLEMGADDYMAKPFTPSILKAKIRNLINTRKVLRQTYTKLLIQLGAEGGNIGDNSNEGIKDQFIREIVKIIEDNILEQDFSVKKLASQMNMSQPTLYRKVKQVTNCTIIELIIGVRIRKAAMLLRQNKYSIQEVAEMVGYNDISTFRKRFVEIFGTTPSAYADAKNNS
jgi:CheY-like chemotaxis protein/AraC-like DNA-binding protein